MPNEEINRREVTRDEHDKIISNVQASSFIQDPNNNTDITQDPIDLYYTDLDIQDDAELFTTPSAAFVKAQNMIHKFPSHIVKFFMFYYTEKYENGNLVGVKKEICQVVPGVPVTEGTEREKRDYRQVKRKSLKSIYDKIDFIMIYRPKNGIKWYTVSKEELNTELAVIKEFYGLTNFPDKVGQFYFSKKIGKWLATKELENILVAYEKAHKEVPVIYPDMITDDYIKAEHKSILELLWDWIVAIFKGMGDFFASILGIFFDKNKWEAFFDELDKDEDGIPDSIEDFANWFTGVSTLHQWNWNEVFPFSQKIQNFKEALDELFNNHGSFWDNVTNLWNRIKTLAQNFLNIVIPEDE